MHDQIFCEKIIAFTSVFPLGVNHLAQPETRQILQKGGKVLAKFDEEMASHITTVLTKSFKSKFWSNFLETKKFRFAVENGIGFCNILWLRFCILYLAPLKESAFGIESLAETDLEDLYLIEEKVLSQHPLE